MTHLKSYLAVALTILLLTGVPFTTAQAGGPKETQKVTTLFEVTVRQGPSAGLLVYGELTLHVNPETGDFTGTLRPAIGKDTGEPLPSVLFTQSFGGFIPNPAGVTELKVRGTINGHAINMLVLNVGAAGQNVVGVGTMENNLAQWLAGAGPGFVAGPAVGPAIGDSGDWVTPCCSHI